MDKRYEKLVIESIGVDPTYQRDFDEARARAMSKEIDDSRIGVPVVSRRADGKLVVVDAQHRLAAKTLAGQGGESLLCEVHIGLTKQQEAELFLKLNGGRKAIRAWDRYRARMVARDPIAVEFTRIVEKCGLRIGPAQGRNTLCAVQSIESVHRRNRNLETTLSLLKKWGEGDPASLDGDLLKDVSCFLLDFDGNLDVAAFAEKLSKHDPAMVLRKIRGAHDLSGKRRPAANSVLREIYNARRLKKDRLPAIEIRTAN